MLRNVVDEGPKPRLWIIGGRVNRSDHAAELLQRLDIVVMVAERNIQPHIARRFDLALGARANRSELNFAAIEAESHCHTRECPRGLSAVAGFAAVRLVRHHKSNPASFKKRL